jgi:hypothetical protein
MTEKQGYEAVLTELRKAKAPSLHLEDYNYYMNKGIQEYINERYNHFAKTQQLSDDLQALTTSTTLFLTSTIIPPNISYTGTYIGDYNQAVVTITTGKKYGSDFIRFNSPNNYLHFLGSHVTMKTLRDHKCYPKGYEINITSKRMTADVGNNIIGNAYSKPAFERPYHSFSDGSLNGVKPDLFYFPGDLLKSGISSIYIDYLKEPAIVNLTITQRDLPLDTSAILEFPEYVCKEIIKRIVKLILEASSDPRLATNPPINNTIP